MAEIGLFAGRFVTILGHIPLALEQPNHSKSGNGKAQPRSPKHSIGLLDGRSHHALHAIRKECIERSLQHHDQAQGETKLVHDIVTTSPWRLDKNHGLRLSECLSGSHPGFLRP